MNDQITPSGDGLERYTHLRAFCVGIGLDPTNSPNEQLALNLIDEALTHTSTGLSKHHERLEFLGDAVLRLAASEYIEKKHQQLSVGERSALRSHLVSDRWLASVGQIYAIDSVQRIGEKAKGDTSARATLLAEGTEALIGAIYQGWNSLKPVHQWLGPHWEKTANAVLADPHRGNSKSVLQEWSQGQGQGLPNYNSSEISKRHGDPRRFRCTVTLPPNLKAEGWGGSRREAEQQAARNALNELTGS